MNTRTIVARVEQPELLGYIKIGAAALQSRLTSLNAPLTRGSDADQADLLILELGGASSWREFDHAKIVCPKARLLVVANENATPDDVRRLFRAGASDVLSPPVSKEQIMTAMSDAIGAAANAGSGGFVLGVVKAAGGAGATTIAVNVAGHFANPRGKRIDRVDPMNVSLIDFDLQMGAAALALDMAPRGDITDIIKAPKRLDALYLDGLTERHRSGLRLLAAPPKVLPLEAMSGEVALQIVDVAARSNDLVVFELPSVLNDWNGALLRRADHILLVSSTTVRGVAGGRRVLDAADELGVDSKRWSLVFNRLNSVLDGNDLVDQARHTLGAPVIGSIAEDSAARVAADRGRLIWETAPNSRFARELRPVCLEITRLLEQNRYPLAQHSSAR